MDRLFSLMERFAPETLETIQSRYQVLRQVMHRQPVGRRQLVKDLGFSERAVRSEIDILKERGIIHITPAGLYLTPAGETMLQEIDEIIPFLYQTQTLAEKIKHLFNIPEVIVVPGDSYIDQLARKDLGRAAARYLKKLLYPSCTLAVTGGTTLAEMADAIGPGIQFPDVLVVPARGGLGEDMEQQAGTIAAKIATAIGAQYRLLHIPDNLEESTVEILKNDFHIARVIESIKSCDILVHGIGSAIEMANRRRLSADEIDFLRKSNAVGEALRYYFDEKGKIVYEVPGVGLELTDLDDIETVIAVAGGSNKAQAIEAVLSNRQEKALITDEGAAREIIKNNKQKD
ncbi:MAG: sugar-binding domain-containing protein [Syntrophomonadaceae bacterium]|nr:sugar-binding domain-containing protein [Syntrophomonadaceae bacterium]